MAYMSQENKATLAAEIKKVIPQDWKYTLSVSHHSTLVLTITGAPVDLIAENLRPASNRQDEYLQLNTYHLHNEYESDLRDTFARIHTAMNVGNWDRSQPQSDYFDVGWYTRIQIGAWKRPFRKIEAKSVSAVRPTEPTYEELKARLERLMSAVVVAG